MNVLCERCARRARPQFDCLLQLGRRLLWLVRDQVHLGAGTERQSVSCPGESCRRSSAHLGEVQERLYIVVFVIAVVCGPGGALGVRCPSRRRLRGSCTFVRERRRVSQRGEHGASSEWASQGRQRRQSSLAGCVQGRARAGRERELAQKERRRGKRDRRISSQSGPPPIDCPAFLSQSALLSRVRFPLTLVADEARVLLVEAASNRSRHLPLRPLRALLRLPSIHMSR